MSTKFEPLQCDDLGRLRQFEIYNETASQFKDRFEILQDVAKFAYKLPKEDQSARSSLKYKPQFYKIGDELWINKSLFVDSYSKSQASHKLYSKRFGTFKVLELVGMNGMKFELPSPFKIHDVLNPMHTVPFQKQNTEIVSTTVLCQYPVPAVEGTVYVVDKIMKHRMRGRVFQFLTLMNGDPIHDAKWQPMKDFTDMDGTMNRIFLNQIKKNEKLKDLWGLKYQVVEVDNRGKV